MESKAKYKTSSRTAYVCKNCHARHARWAGKCSHCESWNSIEELQARTFLSKELKPLCDLKEEDELRISTRIQDVDQVLGGGLVPASLLLLAGEPGVGKSTLMLELTRNAEHEICYFSGEESAQQILRRAKRMSISNRHLLVSRETDLESICAAINEKKPRISIIDSIQTVYRGDRGGAPGNAGQLREAAVLLLETARQTNCSIFVTGHITKDGAIAGPRLLEHMVDLVLYFESDRSNHYRILRAVKNRFGPVGEIAVFEMIQEGLKTVVDFPLLLERKEIPGAVHSLIFRGSRPFPVEVQALVCSSSGPPKRMTEGLDNRRLILLSAVLEKYLRELKLAECDIFVNLLGGFSSDDPGLDLAQCAAIVSSCLEIPLRTRVACLGELSLAGEVRPIERLAQRVKELQNIGFQSIFLPEANKAALDLKLFPNLNIYFLSHVKELLDKMQEGILSLYKEG